MNSTGRTLKRYLALTAFAIVASAWPAGAAAGPPAATVSATCIVAPGFTTVNWSGRMVASATFSWYDANGDVTGQSGQAVGPGGSGTFTLATPFTSARFTTILWDKHGRSLGFANAVCTT